VFGNRKVALVCWRKDAASLSLNVKPRADGDQVLQATSSEWISSRAENINLRKEARVRKLISGKAVFLNRNSVVLHLS
jgi:hypothetical protein